MTEEKKEPVDFLKVLNGIEKNKEAELREAFKQLRLMYLNLLEAGFTMEEAMAYLAALTRGPDGEKK
jgi:hypothetical protein